MPARIGCDAVGNVAHLPDSERSRLRQQEYLQSWRSDLGEDAFKAAPLTKRDG